MVDLEGKVIDEKDIVADLNVKLKEAMELVVDVVNKNNYGLLLHIAVP